VRRRTSAFTVSSPSVGGQSSDVGKLPAIRRLSLSRK
jgi:hypothetical protein